MELKPIQYLTWITREFVQANPEARFVFGDNLDRKGLGGQARAMRGEPNAIGVATKRHPTMEENAFFTDTHGDLEEVHADLERIDAEFKSGRVIYAPADGLGTGLSQLPQRAPLIYLYIYRFFRARSLNHHCPWQTPEGTQAATKLL